MDCAEEVGGELVVSCGDAAEVLETAEHPLDGVAALVERLRKAAFPAAVGFGRDVGDRALLLDEITDGVAVIGLVGEHDGARRKVIQQHISGATVGDIAGRQQEAERPAFTVGERVELAVAAAPADADRLAARPPFPPPAERCAFMWVLSIRTAAGGPPAAASATNMSCHTPFAAQRTNRL